MYFKGEPVPDTPSILLRRAQFVLQIALLLSKGKSAKYQQFWEEMECF